jgi:type VI secretion system secreted protein VgrG
VAQKLTQDHRIGVFTTPLGKDVLVLVRLDASEGLSELFEFRIEAYSEQADLNFDGAIGQQCTLKIKTYGQEREFNGILVEAQWVGARDHYYAYRVVLRPWFWLLTRTTDCRIFLDKKVPEIIKEVFQDRGFTDFESKLTDEGSYPKHEYCVQYRETDFNFITRLMEKEGIYYFFKHEGGKHKLIMADSKSSHEPVPGRANTPYLPNIGQFHRTEEHVYEWISERRFETGKIELNDYNYLKPNAQMLSDAKGSERYTRSDMEVYDYPGKYKEKSIGERYAKIQLEAEQARDHHRHANGDSMSLFAGGLTKLKDHPQDSQNIQYLVVRASHTFMAEAYATGAGSAGGSPYYGSYEFMPSDRPFRAPIVTPKPLIHGIQTAKVVTKDDGSSEEIDVEELTEIYVRFYWDRKKKRSCKVRCAQVWSGKRWGGQFIPRVGQEAVIEFLEGDPDRPLVVGTVYNDEYKPPYELPAKKTIAGIKSDSSKGGNGYNEWHFEDKKGSEKITVHAEKDLDTTVLNKETRTIGEKFVPPKGSASRETTLKNGDDNLTIQMGDQTITIPIGKQTTTAGMSITIQVGPSIVNLTPGSISLTSPSISLTAVSAITLTAPNVTIGAVLTTPSLVAGAAVVGGIPI